MLVSWSFYSKSWGYCDDGKERGDDVTMFDHETAWLRDNVTTKQRDSVTIHKSRLNSGYK